MFSVSVTFPIFRAHPNRWEKKAILSISNGAAETNLVKIGDLKLPVTEKIGFEPFVNEWIGSFNYLYNVGRRLFFKTNYKAPNNRIIMIFLDEENP